MMTDKYIIKRIELVKSMLFNLRCELSNLDDSILNIENQLQYLIEDIKKKDFNDESSD